MTVVMNIAYSAGELSQVVSDVALLFLLGYACHRAWLNGREAYRQYRKPR